MAPGPDDQPDDIPTQADLLADAGSTPQPGHPAEAQPTGESVGEHLSTGSDTVEHTETGTAGDDADR